jgi:hypothetical protein
MIRHPNDYQPICDWPYPSFLEWSDRVFVAVVDGALQDFYVDSEKALKDKKGYITAHFIAYPQMPFQMFCFGEGETIEEAEKEAFQEYQRKIQEHKNTEEKSFKV